MLCVLFPVSTSAQMSVDEHVDAETLVRELFAGRGLKIRNVRFSGNPQALAKFTNPSGVPHFEEGFVMSTGKAADMAGPNNNPKTSTVNGRGGDKVLYNIAHGRTFDAATLEFDFMADRDSVSFNYFFASEEYNDYVGSTFNDAFVIILSGPGFRNGKNLGVIPGTTTPVNVNSVSYNNHRKYYKDNNPFTLTGKINETAKAKINPKQLANFQYDGMTRVLSAQSRVKPKEVYHLKIIIADAGDGTIDSAVLFEAGSFNSQEQWKHVLRRQQIAEQRRLDSLARAQAIADSLQAIADSIAAVEQARADSIAAAEKAYADSIAALQPVEAPEESADDAFNDGPFYSTDSEDPHHVEDIGVDPPEPAPAKVSISDYRLPPGAENDAEYKLIVRFEPKDYIVDDRSEELLHKGAGWCSAEEGFSVGIYIPRGDQATNDLRFDMIRLELIKAGYPQHRIFRNGFSFLPKGNGVSRDRAEVWFRTVN